MRRARMIQLLSLSVLAGALAAGAPAAAGSDPVVASLSIRHQAQGCHAWSLDDGPYRVHQLVAIAPGQAIDVTNNDVMSHELVETSGPKVTYTRVTLGAPMGRTRTYPPAMLARMGATTKITFARAGVYRFTTKAGEASMVALPTVGADNVLRLTVRVR